MVRKRLRAVLFGPQGSGKGTQGQLLADWYGVPIIGAGDLCREEIEEGGALGHLLQEYVSHGMLAPDELINSVMQKRLKEMKLDRGFILDGWPRNVEQATIADKIVKINLAIQIKLSDKTAVKRLEGRRQCAKCRSIYHIEDAPPALKEICAHCTGKLVKRDDDEEETIRKRLAIYHFMTEPLAIYYRQRGVLLGVNGEQPIQSLFDELKKKLAKLGFVA